MFYPLAPTTNLIEKRKQIKINPGCFYHRLQEGDCSSERTVGAIFILPLFFVLVFN
jgi:hypothetical protein